jgi:hypothetical protein
MLLYQSELWRRVAVSWSIHKGRRRGRSRTRSFRIALLMCHSVRCFLTNAREPMNYLPDQDHLLLELSRIIQFRADPEDGTNQERPRRSE